MSRYVERAESVARIVNANLQLMMDLPTGRAGDIAGHWPRVAACLGDNIALRKRKLGDDPDVVLEFLLFNPDNPNSITSCLASARENARTIRELITSEMWEQINRTYLWLQGRTAYQYYQRNTYDFFQRVMKSLQLFQGITDAVMHRSEGWEFIQLGKFLERADKTTRILDDKFFLPTAGTRGVVDPVPQWSAILRGCNARVTYQRLYASAVDPNKAAELLILNAAFPRSVSFCVLHVDASLRRISGVPAGQFCNEAEKRSGRLLSDIAYSDIDEILADGLHDAMDQFQVQLNGIGEAIADTYINPSTPPVVASQAQLLSVPQ